MYKNSNKCYCLYKSIPSVFFTLLLGLDRAFIVELPILTVGEAYVDFCHITYLWKEV